jgi:endonuclease/exonuclease/phosphatase family metal-dependent hydrolase
VVNIWMSLSLPNSLIVLGKFLKNNVHFGLANVYAPCDNRGRQELWHVLGGMLQRYNSTAWCILGDFNAVRSIEERRSRSVNINNDDFAPFNHFIDDNFLFDLPLCGRNFTWYRGDGLSMSRLDHFLLSEDWLLLFPNCIQSALPRGLSDHCPIMLTIDDQN